MAEEEQQYNDADVQDEGYDGEPYDEAGMEEGADGEGGDEPMDELEAMKKKLKDMEEEAARLRDSQQGKPEEGGEGVDPEAAGREEADARSVYVGNVDWGCTPEELQQHFQSCGTVNRVTILTDRFGNPKGFAYVEFLELDAVDNALLQDNSELRGRSIKVLRKRTNVPGLKRGRGRGRGHFGAGFFPPRGAYHGAARGGYYGPPRGGFYGYVPRGRGRGRGYAPY